MQSFDLKKRFVADWGFGDDCFNCGMMVIIRWVGLVQEVGPGKRSDRARGSVWQWEYPTELALVIVVLFCWWGFACCGEMLVTLGEGGGVSSVVRMGIIGDIN